MTKLRLSSFAIAFVIAGAASAQERPTTATMVDKGVTIALEGISFDPGASPDVSQPASGTGTLVVSTPARRYESAGARITDLKQNADGSAIQARIQLAVPLNVEDFVGTTIQVVAPAGTVVQFLNEQSLKVTAAAPSRLELGLPLRVSDNTFARIAANELTVTKTAPGFDLTVTGATSLNPVADKALTLGAATLRSTGLVDFSLQSASDVTWTATLRSAAGSIALNGLMTDDPNAVGVSVQNASVNQDGLLTFAAASLVGEPVIRPTGMDGFELKIRSATVTMTDNVPTAANVLADLTFPSEYTDANGSRYILQGLQAQGAQDDGLILTMAGDAPPFNWRGLTFSGSAIAVDLSSLDKPTMNLGDFESFAQENRFTGVLIGAGTVQMPESLLSDNAKRVKVSVKGFSFETAGPSGNISFANVAMIDPIKSISGFNVKDVSGNATLTRGRFTQCAINSKLQVPLSSATPVSMSDIEAGVVLNDDGLVHLDIKPNAEINLDQIGCRLKIERGQLIKSPNAPAKVMVSGDLIFTLTNSLIGNAVPAEVTAALNGAKLRLQDVGFDASGKFYFPTSGSLNLANPLVIDLKIVRVEGRAIGFETKDNKLHAITISGGAALGEELGLPFTAGLDFGGLKIAKNDSSGPPVNVALQKLGIDIAINDLFSVAGQLEFGKSNSFGSFIQGGADLSIADTFGVKVTFGIAEKGWFVGGGVPFPPVTVRIPYPPPAGTPLFNIYGAYGGLGMNLKLRPGGGLVSSFSDVDFMQGNGLFQLGLVLGDQITGNVWWGMATLSMGLPAFILDLTGQFSFLDLEGPGIKNNEYFDTADRVATVYANLDLSDLPNDVRFTVGGDVFLSMLQRENYLLALSGEMQMKVSKDEKFIRAGWEPKGQSPLKLDLMQGESGIDLELKGGCELDFQRSKFGLLLDGKVTFDLGAFEAKGNLSGRVNGNLPSVSGGRVVFPTAEGDLHFAGSASFPDFPDLKAEAEAFLSARLREVSRKPQLSARGRIEGSVRFFGKSIDVEHEMPETVLFKVN